MLHALSLKLHVKSSILHVSSLNFQKGHVPGHRGMAFLSTCLISALKKCQPLQYPVPGCLFLPIYSLACSALRSWLQHGFRDHQEVLSSDLKMTKTEAVTPIGYAFREAELLKQRADLHFSAGRIANISPEGHKGI